MIPYGKHHVEEDDIEAVAKILRSSALTQGRTVDEFERVVAEYVGAKYAVAVSSGTAALHLAALAAGVGPGSRLLTSPITFVASANAGLCAGGAVGFVDVDPATANMSPALLVEALAQQPDVRAVVPVHYAGLACDMESIAAACASRKVAVIEDAAHALGSVYPSGKRVGSCQHSLMTVFSFHPVKAIAAGEGGMITTNDYSVYRHLLRLRSHGITKLDDSFQIPAQAYSGDIANPWYYEMQELGYHYRITDIQCALGISQFGKLGRFIARREQLAQRYDAAFAATPHLRPAQAVPYGVSGRHLYVLRIDFNAIGKSRAQVMLALRERGVGSQVHYIPVPAHPYYRALGFSANDYPHSLDFYDQCLSIPLHYALKHEEQSLVIDAVQDLCI
jgi:UDP-4-amino-4,6-dideoxy-N-acetyl-beta-L-altrosamine transaminase